MSKNNFFSIILCLIFISAVHAQQASDEHFKLLNDKLQLLDAKLQLLDSKVKLLNTEINQLPVSTKVIVDTIKVTKVVENQTKGTDSSDVKPWRSAIMLNPSRLFEGIFQLSYERALNDRLAIEIAALATYVSKSGFGSGYLKNQSLAAYDEVSNSYVSYNGEMITGWGIALQVKNYLLPRMAINLKTTVKAPRGLYVAAKLMYRKVWIRGINPVWSDSVYVDEEISQNLDVFAGGIVLGGKFTIAKVFCVDIYAGGILRLSKYTDEPTFTRYKKWNNIDYSGVLPTAGINIGILK